MTLPAPYWTSRDGRHTLYCGQCENILPALAKADLVIADPPYGIGENAYRVASRSKLAKPTDYGSFEWDSQPATQEQINCTINAGRRSIIWGGNYFGLPPARGWLVWDKINGDNCFADAELAWTNCETSVRVFRFMWNGMLRDGEARGVPRVHPAQKPVELMLWCLSFVPDAKTVIDPFAGSGTVGLACMRAGISSISIEREPKYCAIAAVRLERESRQPILPLVITRNLEQVEMLQ